jgi:hypothetical protein
MVKNNSQPDKFKLAAGELWKETFEKILPHDCPAWVDKIKMCARWHIKGDCYNNCSREISHITNNNIPNDKQAAFSITWKSAEKRRARSPIGSSGWSLAASEH